jgi:Zn ribbon nucleic-acid-binding protein
MQYVSAYRCAHGHISHQCPFCGSYDTAAWSDLDRQSRHHVICVACGNDSIADR